MRERDTEWERNTRERHRVGEEHDREKTEKERNEREDRRTD